MTPTIPSYRKGDRVAHADHPGQEFIVIEWIGTYKTGFGGIEWKILVRDAQHPNHLPVRASLKELTLITAH